MMKEASNVAAAVRIPEILASPASLWLRAKATPEEEKSVLSFLDRHLEVLARAACWIRGPEEMEGFRAASQGRCQRKLLSW